MLQSTVGTMDELSFSVRLLMSGNQFPIRLTTEAPFGWADKPAEKHCWLICCEKKNTVLAEKIS
jgi:hypothetical protein